MTLKEIYKERPDKERDLLKEEVIDINSLEKFHGVLGRLPFAIYYCDSNGKIIYYNNAAAKLWGRGPDLNKELWCGSMKIFDADGKPIAHESGPMAIFLKEGRMTKDQEIIIERPDGERRHVIPNTQAIYDATGKTIGALNTFIDITDLRRSERSLQDSEKRMLKFSDTLEQKIEDRTSELLKRNEALEQFAFIASHDLQEPLRKIQMFSEMIESGTSDEAEMKKYLGKIRSASHRMTNLIKDILNYSRLSTNSETFSEIDLNNIISNIEIDFELMIVEKKAIISYSDLPVIKGSSVQISQLFSNLISNSLKFCTTDPTIEISSINLTDEEIKKHEQLTDNVKFIKITFKDNGIGFDQKYADRIFNLFHRLHDQQDYSGTGIGLTLCKKIVENHQGVIEVESAPGKGTAFYIYFPV